MARRAGFQLPLARGRSIPLRHHRIAAAIRHKGHRLSSQSFKKLDASPAYKLVYDAVEQEIMDGRLKLNDILPTELQLAEQFGINRSTVREGIRLLEQSGLVQRQSAKRLAVAVPHMAELASRTSRALKLHQVTFRELWEAALAIEPVIARYAADRISPDDVERLKDNLREMEAMADSPADVVRLDIVFHDLLAQSTRNRALILAREPISLLFMPAGLAILPRLRTQQRVIDAHRAILKALQAHRATTAETWMRRHIEDFRRGFVQTGLDLDQPLNKA
jgi:DNA-binding FadR family transcriptional regulator